MIIKKEPAVPRPVEGAAYWEMILELLESEQYEQVAAFLQEAQAAGEKRHKSILTDILAATQRICLILDQCHAEEAWHRQAAANANRREDELKQNLYAILKVVSRYRHTLETDGDRLLAPPAHPLQIHSGEAEPAGLLQQLQRLLGWPTRPRLPEGQLTEPSSSTIFASPPKAPRSPVAFSAVQAEAPADPAPVSKERLDWSRPSLSIYCLGPFQVYQDEQLAESCSSRKGWSVFKYLVSHHQQPVSKDILMDIFWPEAEPEAARRNLHQAIYALRQSLKVNQPDFHHIQFENDGYRLNPALTLWLDYEAFEKQVQKGRQYERDQALDEAITEYGIAEGLYRGDFMAEDLYEDWPLARRQNLWQSYLATAYRLAKYYLGRQEYAAAISISQRILKMDTCQEQAHQNLMRCYLARGQRHLAILQYQLCVQALKAGLDLLPSAGTQALYDQIDRN